MTIFASGASAASRKFVNKIAEVFKIPKFHTGFPSDDVNYMLELAVAKVRSDAGLEDNEAEKLRISRTVLRDENSRLRHEKRLSDLAAENSFAEVERLRAEIKELRTRVRALGGAPQAPSH